MLWGAVAGAIPVVIHYLFRSRYRSVPFPALHFLLRAVEESRRRLKFLEMLLMALRIALLVLIAVAFARPTSGAVGAGGPVDAVLVLDTSLSMDAHEAGRSRWQRARAAAQSVLDQLPAHSTAQIIAASDRVDAQG